MSRGLLAARLAGGGPREEDGEDGGREEERDLANAGGRGVLAGFRREARLYDEDVDVVRSAMPISPTTTGTR